MKKTLLALAVAAVSTFAATASAASFDLLPNENTKVTVGLGAYVESKFSTNDERSVDYNKSLYSKTYTSGFYHKLQFSPSLKLATKYNDWSLSAKFKLRGLKKTLEYSQTATTSDKAAYMYNYIEEPKRTEGKVAGDLLNFGVDAGVEFTLSHPAYGELYVTNKGDAKAADFSFTEVLVKKQDDKTLNVGGLNRGVRYTFPAYTLSEGNVLTAKVAYLDNVTQDKTKGKDVTDYKKAQQVGLYFKHQDLVEGVKDGALNLSYGHLVHVTPTGHSSTANAVELNYSVNTYGLTTKVHYTRLAKDGVVRPEVKVGSYYNKLVARNLGVDFSYSLNDYANFEVSYDYTKGHYHVFKDEYNYFKFSKNHYYVEYSTAALPTNFLGTTVKFVAGFDFAKSVLRADSVKGSTYSKFLERDFTAKLTFNFL